ncbi:NTP transferase domain-containing protein [Solirubrobacter sp. CPCC 204708]|nr:NTP transferase domain-containing protein [Solirubrobacter deserti]
MAGGRGRRLGGEKALVELGGRPLLARPLAAARAAGLDAVVVAKAGTVLPDVPTWIEPDEPTHPLLGLVTALGHGGPVVAVACDQPWITPELLRALADHEGPALAVEREPFPGRYEPLQLPVLRDALAREDSLRATLGRLQPAVLGAPREQVASVNTREDLAAAEHALADGPDATAGPGPDGDGAAGAGAAAATPKARP